jgi:UDP-3-O-[3-hydroxymyristoyl] glucosamine N-acyltransferase
MRLSELAHAIGAQLISGPPDRPIEGIAPHPAATISHLIGAFEPRFARTAATAHAGAALCDAHTPLAPQTARLIADDPRAAWSRALRCLHPVPAITAPNGVHPSAVIDPSAVLDPSVVVGPFVVIGAHAHIGAHTQLFASVYIGAHAHLGAGCVLHPRATVLDHCQLGDAVFLGSGAVIGGPGFGLDDQGRVPHIGRVIIGDGAQLGAQTCVDRGTIDTTRIGAGAFIDNLVQIGHNAQVGPGAVLCGQVGLAGGAIVEAGAVLGGQAGVAGTAVVGARARVAAQSGVTRALPAGGTYSGHPAEPNRQRLQRLARLKRLFR